MQVGTDNSHHLWVCVVFRKSFTCFRVPDLHATTTRKLIEMLSTERKQRGWSQETLAVAARVSPSCIQHLEHDRSTPTLMTLLKLAAAMEMDLPDLLREALQAAEPKKPKPRR